jgi:hypothetical protein
MGAGNDGGSLVRAIVWLAVGIMLGLLITGIIDQMTF